MVFFVLARFVPVKYSRAFVERPSQGTSSLASRLTTVSLDNLSFHKETSLTLITVMLLKSNILVYVLLKRCIAPFSKKKTYKMHRQSINITIAIDIKIYARSVQLRIK